MTFPSLEKLKMTNLLCTGVLMATVVVMQLQTSSTEISPVVSIVEGVFFKKLDDVILYQRSFPLTFAVDLPTMPEPNLNGESCIATPALCALANATEQIQVEIYQDLVQSTPYFMKAGRQIRSAPLAIIGEIHKALFGVATQNDLKSLHVDTGTIYKRQKALKDALVEEHKFVSEVTANLTLWSKELSKTYEFDLKSVEENLRAFEKSVHAGEILLARVAALIQQNQHVVRIADKLNSVADMCRNNRIPRSVVSEEIIQKRLNTILPQIVKDGFNFACDLNSLWKLPIADCKFSQNELLVTINIPLQQVHKEYGLYEVTKFPFQYLTTQCVVNDVTEFVAKVGKQILPINGRNSNNCHPTDRKFCYIPINEVEATPFTGCATALMANELGNIRKECLLSCKESNKVRVSEISTHVVAVTNVKNVKVECSEYSKTYTIPISVGAAAVRINCGCKVFVDGQFPLVPPFPCLLPNSSTPDVLHLIPAQFTNIASGYLQQLNNTYSNASEIVDWKWRTKLPTLQLTPPKTILKDFDSYTLETILNDSDSILYVWCLILTIVLIYLVYVNLRSNFGYTGVSIPKFGIFAVMILINVVNADEDSSKEDKTSLSMMWSAIKMIEIGNLLLTIFLVFGALIAIIVFWRMYRFARCTYNMTRSLVEDIELPRRRN